MTTANDLAKEFLIYPGWDVAWYPSADVEQKPAFGKVTEVDMRGAVKILLLQNGTSRLVRNVFHVNHPEHIDHVERTQASGGWDYVAGQLTPYEVAELRKLFEPQPKVTKDQLARARIVDLYRSGTPVPRICQTVQKKREDVEAILEEAGLLTPEPAAAG